MDPDEQIVAGILADNSLKFHRLQRLSGGFRNVVFQVDDRYVLRINRHPDNHDCMRRESELQQKVRGIAPVPELCKFGIFRVEAAYQLWEFVAGERLADTWTTLGPADQMQLVDQLSAILEALHAIQGEDYGPLCTWPHGFLTWLDYARAELADGPCEASDDFPGARTVEELRIEIEDRIARCQFRERPVLTHNDLVMTNVIVRGARVAALIDWELAMKAPLDQEVYKLECFCRNPGVVGITGNFRGFWQLMVARNPKMFSHPNLSTRLDAYDLLAKWRMFRYEIRQGGDVEVGAQQFIKDVRSILEGRVSRLPLPKSISPH